MQSFNFIDEGFKAGDRVWSYQFGWGRITEIAESIIYCIRVEFNVPKKSQVRRYDPSGRIDMDNIIPDIFPKEFDFKIPKHIYAPILKKGDWVKYRNGAFSIIFMIDEIKCSYVKAWHSEERYPLENCTKLTKSQIKILELEER